MTAGVILIDAVSSGLLGIAALLPDNISLGQNVGDTVACLHILVLVGKSSLPLKPLITWLIRVDTY